MKITFTYSQILSTAHPKFEVTVNFYCTADVTGEDVELIALEANVGTHFYRTETEPETLPLPDESTHAGAMFAGQLREAARDEAHRLSKIQNQKT